MQKSNKRSFLFIIVLLLFGGIVHGSIADAGKTILIPPVTNEHHRYCMELLKLALSYSGDDYTVDFIDDSSSQTRELQRLRDGKVDVVWWATSRKYESEARPVRIPLYRGLLGYRIFIIRKGEQARFDNINSIEDMKSFTFGQGTDWADTTVLEANSIKVVKTRRYENLFHMLDGGRFDAFPRGVHEPWQELEQQSEMELTVEKNIVFIYRMPMYFFVNKDNTVLANLIEQGLLKAIADGSFEKAFFGSQMIKDVLTKADLEHRKIFYLDNPALPPETPVDDERLWWFPTGQSLQPAGQ